MNRACILMAALACAAFSSPILLSAQSSAGAAATVAVKSASPAAKPLTDKQIERMQSTLADWPNLARYRGENAALPPVAAGQQRVVFFGDSITDNWGHRVGTFFPGKPYVNRGISGQTTPQMLIRFQQDVVHLHPAAVVVLAGTNDIAGNTGPSTPQMIEDNFVSMAAIAKASGIKMILASITPAAAYPWRPGVDPVAEIRQVNQWLKDFCAKEGLVYLDYYSAMVNDKGGMRPGLSMDGVHPTVAGYAIMAPLAEAAIHQALQ
ncbi:MAG: SGNH/GDSL hydrolase family protein [Acidobacteriaceae bacterium]